MNSNSAGVDNLGLPYSSVPLVDPHTGVITRPWWPFISSLYQRVGGPTAPSNSQLAAMINNNTAQSLYADDEYDEPLMIAGPAGMSGQDGLPGISFITNEDYPDVLSEAILFASQIPLPVISGGTGNTTGTATVNANLTGPITSVGNATSVASQTGTGSTFVMKASPSLTTPDLGTPSVCIGTNITGTASALNIGGNAATATTATNQSGGTVSATTIQASGLITPAYPIGILASSSGVTPSSGSIGYATSANASGVSLTTATANHVVSLSLGSGNWLVFGNGVFDFAGGASAGELAVFINDSIAIPPEYRYSILQTGGIINETSLIPPMRYFSKNASFTVYLLMYPVFSVGTVTGTAEIFAIQMP